ncbi:YcdB/YcdC domain-containing protein [Lysinibacillus sp. KU-BSD001]|uniref:YcdB/YcdC domain-containing protein n=1 Tax=Lysinibacillus sp. KU-BSD001 TaxID=3141328 RepID=UPI0036F242BE
MQKESLKQRAQSLVPLRNDFQLVIEEYNEGAMFSWINEAKDEGISVELDSFGNLTRLSIDTSNDCSDVSSLTIDEKKARAEHFLLSHYPDALNNLTFYQTKQLSCADRFYYEQLVFNLPLPRAGCFIDIDSSGDIITFTYNGVKPIPEIPTTFISKEALQEHVRNHLDLQLTITNLSKSVHHVSENGLRLVYEVNSFHQYKADTLQSTLTIVHEEHEPENYMSVPPFSFTTVDKQLSIEEIIGITDNMEIIREVDWDYEIGIVWRDKEWAMKKEDYSMNSFFMKRSEDTVKAFISKETGKVRSFMWFLERQGDLQLNHEECFQKAIQFLQIIVPDVYPYLQQVVREREEDDNSMKESFVFYLHNRHGITIQELVVVAVNRTTGLVDYYSGPRIHIEQLRALPTEPAISLHDAQKIVCNHMDFELAWKKDYDSETDTYFLTYQLCDQHTRNSIRYIDAMTGAVITDK